MILLLACASEVEPAGEVIEGDLLVDEDTTLEGVEVRGTLRISGAHLDARDLRVAGAEGIGVEILDGGSVDWIGGAIERSGGIGLVVLGGSARLEGVRVVANTDAGVVADEASLEFVDVLVSSHGPGDENTRSGIAAWDSVLVAEGLTVEDQTDYGVYLEDSELEGSDLAIHNVWYLGDNEEVPAACLVARRSTVVLDEVSLSRCQDRGLHAWGASVDIAGFALRDTWTERDGTVQSVDVLGGSWVSLSQAAIEDNPGPVVVAESTLELSDSHVLRADGGALIVQEEGTLARLTDVEVAEVVDVEDRWGPAGIWVQAGAHLEATRLHVHDQGYRGLRISQATAELVDLRLEDVPVDRVRGQSSTGIAAYQADLSIDGLVASGIEGPAVYTVDSTLSCSGCEASDTVFAAIVQAGGHGRYEGCVLDGAVADEVGQAGYGLVALPVGEGLVASSTRHDPEVELVDSVVGGGERGGLYLRAETAGSLLVQGSDVAGGSGRSGRYGDGLALVGPAPLELRATTLHGGVGAAVYLDGATSWTLDDVLVEDLEVGLETTACGVDVSDWEAFGPVEDCAERRWMDHPQFSLDGTDAAPDDTEQE